MKRLCGPKNHLCKVGRPDLVLFVKFIANYLYNWWWLETWKEVISWTSCATWQRYSPVYTTPLSSTDMLMLLVPFVVRFRAESCLLSIGNTSTKESCVNKTKSLTLHYKTLLYVSVTLVQNWVPPLNYTLSRQLCVWICTFYISLKSPVSSILRNCLLVPSDRQWVRQTVPLWSKCLLAEGNLRTDKHTCTVCMLACICFYKLNRSTYRPAVSYFLTVGCCGLW